MLRQVAVVLLLVSTAQGSDEATRTGPPPSGSVECPCLTATDPRARAIARELADAGYLETYGLGGCKAYDEGNQLQGCHVADPPEFCGKPWCYVDVELCPINEDNCRDEGGIPGSEASPFCRERKHEASVILPGTATASTEKPYYSYSTCGALDLFGPQLLERTMSNRNIKISVPAGTLGQKVFEVEEKEEKEGDGPLG